MRVFIKTSHNSVNIYTEKKIEESRIAYTSISRTYHANLKIDHELRENSVLKYIENSRIVSFGRGSGGDVEIEVENGDKLEKLEHMLQVSLIYPEVKSVLKSYSEGELTLEDAYVQLLPYVVAKKLVET